MFPNTRNETMYSYYVTEKEFKVNGIRYRVECTFDKEAHFYCFCNTEVVCEVCIPQEQWEGLNTGLALAYAYNCVLDKMEECVVHSGGRYEGHAVA